LKTRLLVALAVLVLSAWAAPSAWADSDLSALTTGPDETTADADVAYSITASNFGPDDAADVAVDNAVPPGTTFVSLTQDSGPAFSCVTPAVGGTGNVSCTRTPFSAGASATFTLTVHVDAGTPAGTFITDTTSVSTTDLDLNDENNTSSASTLVGPVTNADMGVTESAPEGRPQDTDLTYAITVTNGGPAAAPNAEWSDTLPGPTTFVSLTAPAGWSCTTPAVGGTGSVSCTRGSLAAGAAATFTLVVHIPAATPSGTELNNFVNVTSSATSDPNSENDQASTTTVVGSADLSATLAAPATATAGNQLTYTLTLANAGPDPATAAQAVHELPDGVTFVSLTQDDGPTFAASTPGLGQGGPIGLSRAPFASGDSAQFTLVVALDPRVPEGPLALAASIGAPTGDPNASNNTATDSTTVAGLDADLRVTATGPATATPGSTLTYAIALTNDGPDTAYDVVLANPVPAHTTLASFTQTGGPAFDLTTPPRATRGQLANGQTATFTLKLVVDAGTAAGTKITSTPTASSAIADPDAADSTAAVTTTIALPAGPPVPPSAPPAGPATPPATTPGGTQRPVVCKRVPRLKGKTYKAAKKLLKKRGCKKAKLVRKGKLKRKNGKPSRVRSQSPKAGKRLLKGQKLRVKLR
jgi:uncharacterized repeat protein (TIGR01451 family)